MSLSKTYAVFGLGRYGSAVAKELIKSGAEVMAVDMNEAIVNEMAQEIPLCRCADVTDPEVIKQLGIDNIDVVIIAMASSLEATVMAITLCKEAGVETVIVKTSNEMQKKIFLRVGADKVVFPENESGIRLAKNLLSSGFVDMVELSKNVSMVEMPVRTDWVGKNLIELKLRNKYGINIVATVENDEVSVSFDPSLPLTAKMKLIVIANRDKLGKLR